MEYLWLFTVLLLTSWFFLWGISTPDYAVVQKVWINSYRDYYAGHKAEDLQLFDDDIVGDLGNKYRSQIYLSRVAFLTSGEGKLKNIRLALESEPENMEGYEFLRNLMGRIPVDYNISSYINHLYNIPGIFKGEIIDLGKVRYTSFKSEERRKLFLSEIDKEMSAHFPVP